MLSRRPSSFFPSHPLLSFTLQRKHLCAKKIQKRWKVWITKKKLIEKAMAKAKAKAAS